MTMSFNKRIFRNFRTKGGARVTPAAAPGALVIYYWVTADGRAATQAAEDRYPRICSHWTRTPERLAWLIAARQVRRYCGDWTVALVAGPPAS